MLICAIISDTSHNMLCLCQVLVQIYEASAVSGVLPADETLKTEVYTETIT